MQRRPDNISYLLLKCIIATAAMMHADVRQRATFSPRFASFLMLASGSAAVGACWCSPCLSATLCVGACVCACMCVCNHNQHCSARAVSEREREREAGRGREIGRSSNMSVGEAGRKRESKRGGKGGKRRKR